MLTIAAAAFITAALLRGNGAPAGRATVRDRAQAARTN